LDFFLIPEENAPPPELESLQRNLRLQEASKPSLATYEQSGFVKAVIDPWVNSLHLSLLRRKRKISEPIAKRRQRLQDKAFSLGPGGLSTKEKKELLYDPAALLQLHQRVWESPDQAVAQKWGLPL
jgi:membrane glycosyltransferase